MGRIVFRIVITIAILVGIAFAVVWLTSGLQNAIQGVGLLLTIMGTFLAIGVIGMLLAWNETVSKISAIVLKIIVNLFYVFLGIVVVSEDKNWHGLSEILQAIFCIVGFITCWILINWAMNGGLQRWVKKQGE